MSMGCDFTHTTTQNMILWGYVGISYSAWISYCLYHRTKAMRRPLSVEQAIDAGSTLFLHLFFHNAKFLCKTNNKE